jgi:hypothetical protein
MYHVTGFKVCEDAAHRFFPAHQLPRLHSLFALLADWLWETLHQKVTFLRNLLLIGRILSCKSIIIACCIWWDSLFWNMSNEIGKTAYFAPWATKCEFFNIMQHLTGHKLQPLLWYTDGNTEAWERCSRVLISAFVCFIVGVLMGCLSYEFYNIVGVYYIYNHHHHHRHDLRGFTT